METRNVRQDKESVEYFIGTIVDVEDRALYKIKVDIPGEFDGVTAFPVRGEIDEPKVGDFVLLRSFDPVYHSYFLYQKLKENDFIGFRSMGKMIEVEPNGEYIRVCTFDIETEYTDGKHGSEYRPEPQDWIKLDKDGNLDIYLRKNHTALVDGDGEIEVKGNVTIKVGGNTKVEISGDNEVKISGNTKLEVGGNADIDIKGNTKIKCPNVKVESSGTVEITGGGIIKTGPSAPGSPSTTGPFNGVPACIFSGAPHCTQQHSGI